MEGRIAALGEKGVGIDGPFGSGVDKRDVGGCALGEGAVGQAQELRGAGGHGGDELRPGEDAGFDECLDEKGERRFEADDAEGGGLEFALLVLVCVRGVVGDEAVDGAVADAFEAGGDVGLRAQRGVHFVVRIERGTAVVGEQKVVGADFGADALAGLFGAANEVDGGGGGDVRDVVADVALACEENVALDHDVFGDGGDAGESEARTGEAGVHASAAGEGFVLAMLDEELIEHADVAHGAEAHAGVGDAVAIVGEGDRSGTDHGADLGERLSLALAGDGADG